MKLRHFVTHEPVEPGAAVVSREQETFTLDSFDEDFVYVIPRGKRTRTERYRPQFFQLEVVR